MTVQTLTKSNIAFPARRKKKKKLITGDEFFDMPGDAWDELVEGEIFRMSPPGYLHGKIEVRFITLLNNFVNAHQLGDVIGGEAGIYTHREPDSIRGVDVAFVSHQQMERAQSVTYLDVAPELIVEIMSPNDRWSDIMDKLEEYFAIGVKLVWVADPQRQEVLVYRSLVDVERLTPEDELKGDDVLPGFSAPVSELLQT